VWLFINISSPLILKKAVAPTNASISDPLSQRAIRRAKTAVSASAEVHRRPKAKQPRKISPPERLRRMHDQLVEAYGPQYWWPAQSAFEVIVGAYLTQNTAWKAVERSLANLRDAGALSVDGLRAIPLDKLRRLIQPSGFFTRKAPALKAFVAMLDKEFGGLLAILAAASTATLRERLLALPGVGAETADAILLYALGHPVPVADEYLRRIAERHQLIVPAAGRISYDSLANLTRQTFVNDPEQDQTALFNEFHALTVAVGKAHCSRTPRCEGCPLAADLRYTHTAR
jgi:endonuclease-3 related protein